MRIQIHWTVRGKYHGNHKLVTGKILSFCHKKKSMKFTNQTWKIAWNLQISHRENIEFHGSAMWKNPAKFVDQSWKNISKIVSLMGEKNLKFCHWMLDFPFKKLVKHKNVIQRFFFRLSHHSLDWFSYLITASESKIVWKMAKLCASPRYFIGWDFKILGINPAILPWNSNPGVRWEVRSGLRLSNIACRRQSIPPPPSQEMKYYF